ncbi:MAG TPA: GAF domain-containing SpoIIE family protein phosphatase [Phycisphaerae bacterium]|nr:GAF domain-containing SpoIIE family protein phosphatase [Phycisphaerae bacterium]
MLRDLIDTALLEDFAGGLARSSGLRACVYDGERRLLAASPPMSDFARLTGRVLRRLPRHLELIPLPADEPPAQMAFVPYSGVWYIVAPIYVGDTLAGYVGVGEFRAPEPQKQAPNPVASAPGRASTELRQAREALPMLQRRGDFPAVLTARWAARMLAGWCARELRAQSAAEETALVGDIAELLSGEQDLQTILDRIVAETARVMKCRFCTLRLYNPQTGELTIQAGHNLSQRYLAKGPVLRSESPIDDEALNGNVVYIEDVSHDPRFRYPDDARREGMVSVLTAGMLYRGTPVGVLRVYTNHRQRFRRVHRNLLRAVAAQAATAIVNAQLLDERMRAAETERQLALAAEVQARMVHTPPPPHPMLETAVVFEPTSHLAGDFCDFLTLADGRLAAAVGDVVGKGIPAALLMASVRGALRATAQRCCDLGEALTRLNSHVHAETSVAEFVTLLLIAADSSGRRLHYCSAGHEPLLILRDGEVRAFSEGGLVLGIRPDEKYQQCALDLHPNDFVLLYTDGAVEAANFDDELFGRQRLFDAVVQYGQMPPDQALRNILWDVRRFVGLADQADDITLVGLRVRSAD